jgi:hypothetical protein
VKKERKDRKKKLLYDGGNMLSGLATTEGKVDRGRERRNKKTKKVWPL